MMDVRQQVRTFITQNFMLTGGGKLTDAASLLELQIVDSTGFLELVNFLESSYGIKVSDEEMVPENLESIDNIVGFVARKRQAA
jgi:acyl carrier protein